MKKLLLLSLIVISISGCNKIFSPEEMITKSFNPFKEYTIKDTKVAELVEKGILETEAESNGIDLSKSSAHLISYTKIGTYGKGEVRILGSLTPEALESLKKNIYYKNVSGIVTYTCTFEYSEKNGRYSWSSDFPYKLK